MEKLVFGQSSCVLYPDGPAYNGKPTATIGQLQIASLDEGVELLSRAVAALKSHEIGAILAPMDGDTWHAYRVITESDGTAPYALEPQSGAHDLQALRAAGFEVLEEYFSARADVPPAGSVRPEVAGVNITQWDGKGGDALLEQLFNMAANSFADKLFFKNISREEFMAIYSPLLKMIDPRMVLFAHLGGQMVGFLFGYPDFLQGAKPNQAVLKTYASGVKGVGHCLAWHFHEIARDMGFEQVVHALMHSQNISLSRSKMHNGAIMRKYAIMGKIL